MKPLTAKLVRRPPIIWTGREVIADLLMELLRTGTNLLFQIMSQCYEQWETPFSQPI